MSALATMSAAAAAPFLGGSGTWVDVAANGEVPILVVESFVGHGVAKGLKGEGSVPLFLPFLSLARGLALGFRPLGVEPLGRPLLCPCCHAPPATCCSSPLS